MPVFETYQDYVNHYSSVGYSPAIYRVEIGNPGGTDGFIDDLQIHQYGMDPNLPGAHPRAAGALPTTYEDSLEIAMGNIRWQQVIGGLSSAVVPDRIFGVNAVDAAYGVPATSVQFLVEYVRPSYLVTPDELTPGDYLYGADAVKRFIARALATEVSRGWPVYAPAVEGEHDYMFGPSIGTVTATRLYGGEGDDGIAAAEADITVEEPDFFPEVV